MQIKINGIAVYDYEDSQDYVKLLTTIFDEVGVSNIRSVINGEGESYCTFNKLTVIPQNELPIQLVY